MVIKRKKSKQLKKQPKHKPTYSNINQVTVNLQHPKKSKSRASTSQPKTPSITPYDIMNYKNTHFSPAQAPTQTANPIYEKLLLQLIDREKKQPIKIDGDDISERIEKVNEIPPIADANVRKNKIFSAAIKRQLLNQNGVISIIEFKQKHSQFKEHSADEIYDMLFNQKKND